jgi:hypothetical protein
MISRGLIKRYPKTFLSPEPHSLLKSEEEVSA